MSNIRRTYTFVIEAQVKKHRQMCFIIGPRQVGKTTIAKMVGENIGNSHYFNWDDKNHRILILQGPKAIIDVIGLENLSDVKPLVIFDEIHKYDDWADFLKGFFDTYGHRLRIIVTGSAKLDLFKRGGDSLMGRYFNYRAHPLSVAEIIHPALISREINEKPEEIDDELFNLLLNFGGFPEPFLNRDIDFHNRWKKQRLQLLLKGEMRDLSRIHELSKVEVLAELIRRQVGQLVSYESFARKVRASDNSVRNWISMLKALYYCFDIRPWSKNVSRSLLKEPKYFLWDWSICGDEGSRAENFVAAHLLKAVHFWNDLGFGDYDLCFLRDKSKREVDFVVVKNDEPWFLVEVKLSENRGISPSLRHFKDLLKVPHAFQVVFDMDYVGVDCFSEPGPIIVPAKTFLSQLV